MRPHRPFADWSVESTIGLIFIIGTIITATAIAAILGMLIYTMSQPAEQPQQTVSHYVDKQGDVKRLCLAYRTGDHVDAVSCDLVDDVTGQPEGTN